MIDPARADTIPPSRLDRVLNVFTAVRPGEGGTALLLALKIFLILTSYYVLKVVREALILGEGSAELKSYLAAVQVILLAFVVPYYGRLVRRFPRLTLMNVVTTFFALCPIAFLVLERLHVPIAIVFFLWIGIFNLMIVAQFWSYANDLYSREQGERLFVLVGFGASLGAVVGARLADRLIGPLGIPMLMLVGSALLFAQLRLTRHIEHRETRRAPASVPVEATAAAATAPATNAFAMVLKTRYLLLMALMLLVLNLVNTTGEYILGGIIKDTAHRMVIEGHANGLSENQIIGGFYAKFFSAVNVLGLLLQLFVVSRVIRRIGVGYAVLILPMLSFGAYTIIALAPTLLAVLVAKVCENSADYSLNNTVRNMLFLPCTYEQKFTAKQVIDAFFVRSGDVLSAVLVFAGTTVLALTPQRFAVVNAVLVVTWLFLAWQVGREYMRLTRTGEAPATRSRHAAPPVAIARASRT